MCCSVFLFKIFGRPWQDSNLQSPVSETDALSIRPQGLCYQAPNLSFRQPPKISTFSLVFFGQQGSLWLFLNPLSWKLVQNLVARLQGCSWSIQLYIFVNVLLWMAHASTKLCKFNKTLLQCQLAGIQWIYFIIYDSYNWLLTYMYAYYWLTWADIPP